MKNFLLFIIVLVGSKDFLSIHSVEPTIHIVKMEDMKFVPEITEIKTGETVRWINESNQSHNVFAKDKAFKSTMLPKKGDIYEHTFKTAGEFDYYCQPHRMMGMKGTVIVKN